MKNILITLILMIVITTSFYGCSGNDGNFYSSWMKYISDDVKLIDVVIPGSHDAGSQGLLMNMDTQDSTIYEQLTAGVRYFDLRVKYNGKKELAIYHGVQTGMLFDTVLNELRHFIDNNPSEFLILDFQHFETYPESKLPELIQEVEAAFSAKMSPDSLALKKPVDLASLTMGEIRKAGAKYIVIWGRDEETTLSKDYIFRRDDYLYSPYNKPEHQEDWDRLRDYFPNYWAVNDYSRLFVLQCQPTSGDIRAFDTQYKDSMNDYILSLAQNEELLPRTNIIMRDYIVHDKRTIDTILYLNLSKNNVKKRYQDLFRLI